jgi:hypothetical protein
MIRCRSAQKDPRNIEDRVLDCQGYNHGSFNTKNTSQLLLDLTGDFDYEFNPKSIIYFKVVDGHEHVS